MKSRPKLKVLMRLARPLCTSLGGRGRDSQGACPVILGSPFQP